MKVVYAQRSRRDFEQIRKWIAKEAGNRDVADKYLVRLITACDALSTLPERHPPYRFDKAWRMMPFESYLVLFQIHTDEVKIGHVRHAARKPFGG